MESNHHSLSATRSLVWRVCQFRHVRDSVGESSLLPPVVKERGRSYDDVTTMTHWPFWLLFLLSCVTAVLLAKVLDDRDRRLRRIDEAREAEIPPKSEANT